MHKLESFRYQLETNVIEKWNPSESSGITVMRMAVRLGSSANGPGGDWNLDPNHRTSGTATKHLNSDSLSLDHVKREVVQRRMIFMLTCLLRTIQSPLKQTEMLLFVPSRSGHLLRADIMEIRLADSEFVQEFVNLSDGGASVQGAANEVPRTLQASLAVAIGAAFVSPHVRQADLQHDFANRLSLCLVQADIRPRRIVAILECGKSPASGQGIFEAAKALNIGVLALDKPGHWISTPEYASWRDAFISIDRTPDNELPDRIFAALENYGQKIDGIVSFFDPLLACVAIVAAKLGLATPPVTAYEVAGDKQKTSLSEGRAAYRVHGSEEALAIVRREADSMVYPLIVKPCSGWGSEGVFRVDDEASLVRAIESIDSARHGSSLVVERYCEGPEVDANLVLSNGQLLFFEASDDFPKAADNVTATNHGALQTFIEVANVLPSALPSSELEILKKSLHESLLRLGFCSGFYHLEARVEGSCAKYGVDSNGLVELNVGGSKTSGDASAWLLEINARPPGLQAAWASRVTYGIDFWGLSLCFALNDESTARELSIPFASGHQYWCQIVFIPVPRGGLFESSDVCQELIHRRPELATHISRSHCFFSKGDRVPDPSSGILTWVAYYLVTSRKSRLELMKVAQLVRQETRFVIS